MCILFKMVTEYPEKLDDHRVKAFDISIAVPIGPLQRAYFHKDDFPIGMHTHDFHEINVVVKGFGRHYIENRNCSAEIGNVFAIPPNVRHGYWSCDNLEIFHILIHNNFFTNYAKILANFSGFHILFEIEPEIRQNYKDNIALKLPANELKRLLRDFQTLSEKPYDTTAEIRILLLICEFSDMISAEYKIKSPTSCNRDYLAVMKSINQLRANFTEKFDIEKLASDVNMSRSTYLRHFKYVCHTTPLEYLNNYRVTVAAKDLENTEKAITTIAQDCGFFDNSHLVKNFKRVYGISPKDYRRKIK